MQWIKGDIKGIYLLRWCLCPVIFSFSEVPYRNAFFISPCSCQVTSKRWWCCLCFLIDDVNKPQIQMMGFFSWAYYNHKILLRNQDCSKKLFFASYVFLMVVVTQSLLLLCICELKQHNLYYTSFLLFVLTYPDECNLQSRLAQQNQFQLKCFSDSTGFYWLNKYWIELIKNTVSISKIKV